MNIVTVHSQMMQSIYKSRKTVLEYIKRQGYNTEDYDGFSITEINSLINNNELDMFMESHTSTTTSDAEEQEEVNTPRKVYVKYHLKKSLRQQYIDDYVDELYNLEQVLTENDTLFIISKEDPNESLISHLKHIYSNNKVFIVILSLKRLQFNVLEHSLVPKHTKLNKTEIKDMMKEYNVSEYTKLPEISRFDPIALATGLRPGDVCKIIRPSKNSITGVYYRYCINV